MDAAKVKLPFGRGRQRRIVSRLAPDTNLHPPGGERPNKPDASGGGLIPQTRPRSGVRRSGAVNRCLPLCSFIDVTPGNRESAQKTFRFSGVLYSPRMKLGIINSAFVQAGVDTATGLKHIARIGFDCVDVHTEAVGISTKEVSLVANTCAKLSLPIISLPH